MSRKLKIRWWQHRVGSSPTAGTTSEWTALHSKSPAERLGFSHTAPSFLLLPAKLCFANFRRGPGRPAGRQTCKLCIACGDFFVKVTGALILLLLASPPCRATTHCAPFKKPGPLAGLSLYIENHSLGEWFKRRLMSIMEKEKLPLLYWECGLPTAQASKGRSFKNERRK